MSAASTNTAARRAAAPARAASAPVAHTAMQAAPVGAVMFDHYEEDFRLDLSDIPRIKESLDIDGLKPSLLSRLLDLIAPLKP